MHKHQKAVRNQKLPELSDSSNIVWENLYSAEFSPALDLLPLPEPNIHLSLEKALSSHLEVLSL